jgi:hypothetical protein
MKKLVILIIYCFVIFSSCSIEEPENTKLDDYFNLSDVPKPTKFMDTINNEFTSNNELEVTWKEQLKVFSDSLDLNKVDLLFYIINNLIDTNQFYFEPHHIEKELIKNMISVSDFNELNLVLIKYPHGSKNENATEVILLDAQNIIADRHTFLGSRYNSGTTEIKDWNKNGDLELIYKYEEVLTGLSVNSQYEEVYALNHLTNEIGKIFKIEYEHLDCNPGHSSFITRDYLFLNDQTISVNNNYHTVIDKIKNVKTQKTSFQLDSTKTHLMMWNEENGYSKK